MNKPMRKHNREVSAPQQIEEIIKEAQVIRIGMYDGIEPYIVPLNFGYADNTFYMHCATEGRKLDVVKKHPKVCFELDTDHQLITSDQACGWSMKYKSVMGTGAIEVISDITEKTNGLTILMDHYNKTSASIPYDFSRLMEKTIVLKLTVETMTCKVNI